MSCVARLLILDTAEHEPCLWELTWGLVLVKGDQREELYPRLAITEVRPALEELLQEGHVELCDSAKPDVSIPLAAAFAVIDDDRNWVPQAESNQPAAYVLHLTRRERIPSRES
jgi:hypothetical protein